MIHNFYLCNMYINIIPDWENQALESYLFGIGMVGVISMVVSSP